MPKTEIETRIEELWKLIKEQGSESIIVDGKTLTEMIDGLVSENADLKKKIEKLETESEGQAAASEVVPPATDAVTKEEYELLKQQMADLEDKIANLKVGGNDIDLTKEFSPELLSLNQTDLELDEIKPAISPEALNKALKLDPKGKGVAEDFPFPSGRVIPNQYPPLTMRDWINPSSSTSKFKVSGTTVDNSFDTASPVQDERIEKGAAVKSAPTGGGKSTTLLRCGAFRGLSNEEVDALSEADRAKLGVSLVVPEKSLVGSVLSGHNDWLSDEAAALDIIKKMEQKIANQERKANGELYTEDDIDYRVIKCPICYKKHTAVGGKPYETVHNGASNMINVFFWTEFLDAYVNNPSIIKPWVYFDEAHLKIPVIYRTLITCLIGGLVDGKEKELHRNVRKDQFSVLLLSATYPKLPTSIQLSSKYVKDYYLNDFTKMAGLKDEKDPSKPRHPNLFKRKLLIFADKPEKDEKGVSIVWKKPNKGEKKFDKIDVELLEKDTKVIIANNALRPYITDIIKTLEPPLIFVLSSAYEMGFSLGDVDCVTTGYIVITIVVEENGKWVEKEIEVPAEFYNWLQQRGRVGRDGIYIEPVWMSTTKKAEVYPPKELSKDVPSKLLVAEFEKKGGVAAIDKNVIKKIVDFYNQDKPVPELSQDEGGRYLHIMLIKDLKSKLSPTKLFNVTKEEKEKVAEKKKSLLAKAAKTKDPETKKKITAAANALKAREAGEYIFESEMLKYFQEDKLEKVLKEATNDKLKKWRQNEKDEYIFDATEDADAAMCGFLLGCRDKTKYEVKVTQNSKGENVKLSIKFKPYKKIKEGTQAQLRTLEVPNEVVYEKETEEVYREALFEIPPKGSDGWW
ncbi:protein of unknown function [endosymbiont DhMRE of Dentiscutata heterogama]|uniref:hypothetical protein n=1 Tax=endosymbiont DhMRE of Dentiscutata heterogama TaxID=1609546 RepID=UPI000629D931|nr:hypothetical protein [endosymbiont DhMRE of Dentiscutata heterogama]CFW92854.1 protein of unknown function [endosymbiont DhMRE of Dentiscutata heterogama]